MADATSNVQIDKRLEFNDIRSQNARYHAEAGIVAAADTIAVLWQDSTEEGGLPAIDVELYTHSGTFAGGTANLAVTDGETLTLLIKDLDEDEKTDQCETNDGFTEIIHTLAGVTGGAATVEQIAISLNADPVFFAKGYAFVDTGGVLEILPRGANSKIKLGTQATTGAAAPLAAALPTTELDNATRLFTKVDYVAAAWTGTYNAATKTYTFTKVSTAINKVHAVVTFT